MTTAKNFLMNRTCSNCKRCQALTGTKSNHLIISNLCAQDRSFKKIDKNFTCKEWVAK